MQIICTVPVLLDDLNVEPSSVVTAIKRVVGKVLIYEGQGTSRQKEVHRSRGRSVAEKMEKWTREKGPGYRSISQS